MTRPGGTGFTSTRMVYGEAAPAPSVSNLRGQVLRIYDSAGVQENEAFDVDGNLVRQSRRLAVAYDITPDWAALDELEEPAAMELAVVGLLEAEVFTTEASFDAMGRPVAQTTPDASVVHLGYGDAGHLESVAANVRGNVTATSFVADLRYNARGQRSLVVYGNGTQTSYAYDPLTFRLTQLQTERVADGHLHQDLRYTYDPVGNITEIRDLAQPIVFTSNAAVSADQRFEYDARYRLVHAEGREHGSQGQPTDEDFVSRASPDDPTGLRRYIEQYLYDAVGNILEMQHAVVGGGWTRHYSYDPPTSGNRLLGTSAPGDAPGIYSHAYTYDAHGSMTSMPHLAAIAWDHADRMQSADLGGGGTVHFTYDAAGQRVRKLRVNQAGTSTWERIYLGGYELYREHVGPELRLERQTLHIGDDAGRVCLVETKTIDDALPIATPANISRYQYSNHLGTVGLELDETGQLISYEESHPYGTTAYRAANSAIDVSPSRYRYTGKERDEETGLGYHGARYYASWLARWTAADPIGLGDGPNRFAYARDRPTVLHDPGGTASVSSVVQAVKGTASTVVHTASAAAGLAVEGAKRGAKLAGDTLGTVPTPPPVVFTREPEGPRGGPIIVEYSAVRPGSKGTWVEGAPGVVAAGPIALGALEATGDLLVGVAEFAWDRITHTHELLDPFKAIPDTVVGTVNLVRFTKQSADNLADAAADVEIAEATGDDAGLADARKRLGGFAVNTIVGGLSIVATGFGIRSLTKVRKPTAKGQKNVLVKSGGTAEYLAGPRLSLDEATAAAEAHGIDMRVFKLEYSPGNTYDWGSVGQRLNLKTLEPFGIIRAPDGRISLTLYDKGLRSVQDAVETISHELNHVRGFLKTGKMSSEATAEAAAEAARPFVRRR